MRERAKVFAVLAGLLPDGLRVDAGKLLDVLDRYGVPNEFAIYSGTHTSAVADRFQNHVLPFFGEHLCATAGCR